MNIDAIRNGIVIDHISAGKAMELYNAGDIDGAHDAGVRAAGALYGYGSREELSRADYLCQTPDDIMRLALCGRM